MVITHYQEQEVSYAYRYLTFGLIQLMLMGLVGHATAETRHLKCTTSITGVDGIETHLDTNGDNVSASTSRGILLCNGFSGLTQDVLEVLPRPLTACPNVPNMSEAYVSPTQGQGRGVITDLKTGDQLFGQIHLPGFLYRYLGYLTYHLQLHV